MAKLEIELTALQATVVRNAFFPANPNKLRAVHKVLGSDGQYHPEKYDGEDLMQLAHRVIAALSVVAKSEA